MTTERKEALKQEAKAFLRALDQTKTYSIQKIAARENRPQSISIGVGAVGRIKLIEFNGDFLLRVSDDSVVKESYLRTSPVTGAGKTDEGVVLIETENSIYRLTEVA